MKFLPSLVLVTSLSMSNSASAAHPNSIYANVQSDLRHFSNALAQPEKFGAFRVLVELSEGKNREQFWLNHVRKDDGAYIGVLETSPRVLSSFKLRQEIKVVAPEILDWNYENRVTRTIYGHYHACAEFKALPGEEAAEQITYWRLACAPSD